MIKKQIRETIDMSESILGLKKGTITWNILRKNIGDDPSVCVRFWYNGNEFIDIMAPLYTRYESEEDMINDILYVENMILDRVPIVLGSYGLSSLVQTVAKNKMKFVYIANIDGVVDQESIVNISDLPLN